MTGPIYQIFVGNNNVAANLAWKALPEDERKALQEKDRASREAVGAKSIVLCDSAWADESHPWWGVIEFPDLQARIDHTRALQKIGWTDLSDAFSLLGTPNRALEEVTIPNPIYKLWIIKNNPGAMSPPGGFQTLAFEKHDALYREYNSQVILSCDSNWCSETYTYFGISVYPNIEANQSIQAGLDQLGWRQIMQTISYLGLPMA